jgi:hypothetical protein
MSKTVKVEKGAFEAVVRKLINAKPAPKASLPKSEKKLVRIIEPLSR